VPKKFTDPGAQKPTDPDPGAQKPTDPDPGAQKPTDPADTDPVNTG
jgi:hypothetical protein